MAEQHGDSAPKHPNCGYSTGGYLHRNNNSFPGVTHGSQLAIFYAGAIHVFDSITPEKAQAIMLIATAAQGAAVASQAGSASAQSSTGDAPAEQSRPQAPRQPAPGPGEAFCKLRGVVPLMRTKSLQRFLEKRRERCLSMAPYNVNKSQHASPESCSGSESSAPANNLNDASASS